MYTPKFRTDVVINNPGGFAPTPVNPTYCLADDSAQELADLLGPAGYPCTVFQNDPWPLVEGSGFSASSTVAWLDFGNGIGSNAGLIADSWNHGLDDKTALRNAIAGLVNLFKGN